MKHQTPYTAYAAAPGHIKLPHADQPVDWPPQMGKPYPDLVLVNHKGELTKLSGFKGKVLLIEPIGMNCPACNALAGGHTMGGFKGTPPERGVVPAEQYLAEYSGGVSPNDPEIIHIQLLLYNFSMQGPTATDAKLWAEHFGYDKKPNYYVLAGGPELVNRASYDMIPGFELVDKNFVLRSDSTGHHPSESWSGLMSKIPSLLKE